MAIRPSLQEDLSAPADLQLRLHRHGDRRHAAALVAPWLTEEGLVMADRRSGEERRHAYEAALEPLEPFQLPPEQSH